jgi:hypothetical protein
MTEQELAVLGRLTPQDYLQFMQGVWAEATVLASGELKDLVLFSNFSDLLSELEIVVIKKSKRDIQPENLRSLEMLRGEIDNALLELQKEMKLYDCMAFSELLNTH